MNLDLSLYLVLDPGALPEGARLLDVAARAIAVRWVSVWVMIVSCA